MLGDAVRPETCRKPEIVADAAHVILTRDSRCCTGNFYIDDEVLASAGVTDFDQYAVQPGTELFPDFFVG
jgi:citronellol/citronellal dehydrogenase